MIGKKIFSIGAAILLLILIVSSSLTEAKSLYLPDGIKNKLQQFIDSNQDELTILDEYLESINEVNGLYEIPGYIVEIMESLAGKIEQIMSYYYNQYIYQWKGMNSLWESDTQERFFNESPWYDNLYYQGWCLSLNKFFTNALMTLVLFGGGTAAAVVALMLGVIPGLGLLLGVIIGAMLALYWDDFYNAVLWLYQNNNYGFIFWLFTPNKSPHLLDYKLLFDSKHLLQPDHEWRPEDWFTQTSRSRLDE